jgi:mitochondrial fission protein ELM1
MGDRPRVWVLLGRGTGGNGQMLSLADALGWPYEAKRLVHNALHVVPNLLLGASRVSVDRRRSDPLEPPWPDLVIGASRRSAPVARWIRKRSGGRAKLVHLLHVQAPLQHFDLIVTMPQYRLPARPNVMQVTGALNRVDPARMAEAAARWEPHWSHLPRPWIGVLVGGDSSSYRFDPETAARLGREVSKLARSLGGALLITTTPRTPPASAEALVAALDAPHALYRWRPDDPDNPYLAYLALCDRFVVTVDSASLPMEACTTGRPVQVFAWPRRSGAAAGGPLRGVRARLVALGLLKPLRDFEAYYRVLRERGLVTSLGEPPPARREGPSDDLGRVVARVRSLFAAGTDRL